MNSDVDETGLSPGIATVGEGGSGRSGRRCGAEEAADAEPGPARQPTQDGQDRRVYSHQATRQQLGRDVELEGGNGAPGATARASSASVAAGSAT